MIVEQTPPRATVKALFDVAEARKHLPKRKRPSSGQILDVLLSVQLGANLVLIGVLLGMVISR
ncbi:hypothetical protein GCM10022286_05690 [Gryllotalpicola daejeonensis]|uniref:Uncharacterized protein n=1 Tax=Gryllotalpicola daejeonensis TaxID=993087 RepID=A0ABP7ZFI2_9MICO